MCFEERASKCFAGSFRKRPDSGVVQLCAGPSKRGQSATVGFCAMAAAAKSVTNGSRKLVLIRNRVCMEKGNTLVIRHSSSVIRHRLGIVSGLRDSSSSTTT